MYTLPRYNYLQRSLVHKRSKPWNTHPVHPLDHKKRVYKELKDLGVSWFGMATMESQYLPEIIHPDEHIGGVVYGRHPEGFAMIIATDCRVIFLDKKPLFENIEEITYDVISGVRFGHAGFGSTVTLYTRVREYPIRSYNKKCAQSFVEYIESRSLEHKHDRVNRYD